MARNVSGDPESPARHRRSPRRRSPSRRERSPLVKRSSHKDSSLEKERGTRHPKSPKRGSPPVSRSPSPRTKRLRRAEAEKGAEVLKDDDYEKRRGREKSNGGEREREVEKRRDKRREREMEREKEIVSNREVGNDRRDRRSSRDEIDERHSRGREREMQSSPSNRSRRGRHRSSSPQRVSGSRRDEGINSREDDERDDEDDSVAKMKAAADALEAKQKAQPSFELSGKLAEETNRFRGVTLLFNEPPDARKPDIRWRLYVFKAGDVMDEPLYIHRQTCYLFGRERRVADIPTDHPSCSKQHAVIQFRQVEKEQPDGTMLKQVRPYIMDLGSTNKTFLNNNPVEPQRYYELFEKDTIKFGNSSREYVLLHENSAGV